MRLIKSIALGLSALSLCACLPKIDTTGWRLLERREVTFGAQHDIFTIPAEIGQLSRLRVVVRKNDLEMSHIKIVFHNNEIWSPDLGRPGLRHRTPEQPLGRPIFRFSLLPPDQGSPPGHRRALGKIGSPLVVKA